MTPDTNDDLPLETLPLSPKRRYNKKRHIGCHLKAIPKSTLSHRVNTKSKLRHQENTNRPKPLVQDSMQKSPAAKNKSKRLLLVEERRDTNDRIDTNNLEYSYSDRSEVINTISTQEAINGEPKERRNENATVPNTIPQQLISLDEAFEPPPKYKSFQNREHIDNMKSRSRASRNTSSTMKLRKLSRANSNASQVNPWTPMDISAQMYPEDDLSATLQIASN